MLSSLCSWKNKNVYNHRHRTFYKKEKQKKKKTLLHHKEKRLLLPSTVNKSTYK